MIDKDNCGCTPPPVIGAEGHWECTPIPDTCKPVELTDKLVKEMYENNVNTEAFTTIEKAQLALLHNHVGGPNGAVKEIVAGKHITVDSTDPTKPIVSTDGVAGPRGDEGPTGPQGIQGVVGIQGPKGADGTSWHLAGRDTEANIKTKTGVPGDMWIITEPTNPNDGHGLGWDVTLTPAGWKDMGQFKGDKGDQGIAGSTGSTGPKGDKGDQGIAGPKGPKGPEGAKGSTGGTGLKGDSGIQGIQGTKGDKGDAGKNGTGITVKGSKADETAVKAITGSKAGDMWIAQDTGHGWVSDGATPTVWTDAGNIQGPKGDTGTAGPQGSIGATGTQGNAGAKGDTGPSGTDGADGTQGIKGDTGSDGAKGDPGVPGPRGFKGDSGIVGPVGPIGPQGNTGSQGNVGPKGNDGQDATITFATPTEVSEGTVTDKAVAPATLPSPVLSFRNLLVNGDFSIWQRGFPMRQIGYTADMWKVRGAGVVDANPGSSIGQPSSYMNLNKDSATLFGLQQTIEGSSSLSGAVVTFSLNLDLKLADATDWNLYINYDGEFNKGMLIELKPNTRDRQSYTFTLPVAAHVNSNLTIGIAPKSGTANFQMDIWDVQLELGTIATPFERRPKGLELALCQRYYESVRVNIRKASVAGEKYKVTMPFVTSKYTAPVTHIGQVTKSIWENDPLEVTDNGLSIVLSAATANPRGYFQAEVQVLAEVL